MKKKQTLQIAVYEAAQFIERAEKILDAKEDYWMKTNAADRGALNRQSMELTRALAKYRKQDSYE